MICGSCGNTYDYDYFAGENLLKAADRALAHKSFSAAKDMYSFMLDKEPANVKALRGLILAKNEVTRLFDITPKIKDGTFVIATLNLDKYKDTSDPGVLGFIGKTERILALYKEYIALKKALKRLGNESDKAEPEDSNTNGGLFYYESVEALKKKAIAYSGTLAVLLILTILCGVNGSAPSWLMVTLIVTMGVLVILVLTAVIRLLSGNRKAIDHEPTEADVRKAKIEEKKSELDRIINEINDVFKEMNQME